MPIPLLIAEVLISRFELHEDQAVTNQRRVRIPACVVRELPRLPVGCEVQHREACNSPIQKPRQIKNCFLKLGLRHLFAARSSRRHVRQ